MAATSSKYSVIVPVYNRPAEVDELLESLTHQTYTNFEVIIVEDGSVEDCKAEVEKVKDALNVTYFFKANSGPGQSRNYGAERAQGEWLVFLDSDCFLDPDYFESVEKRMAEDTFELFGGPDRDHPSFTSVQKGISYSMTSFLTTGGIRGQKSSLEKFKPRSFNMGVLKTSFDEIGGFSKLRFGEDIELSLRVESSGFKSVLIPEAYAYHRRRNTYRQFFKQIYNSGIARWKLYQLFPKSLKVVHFLPLAFILTHLAILLLGIAYPILFLSLVVFAVLVFVHSLVIYKNLADAVNSVLASYVQLFAYGLGFLYAFFTLILGKKIGHAFEKTFYD